MCGGKTLTFFPQISESNPAVLFVGGRLIRNFRFVGEINTVIVFNSVLSSFDVNNLNNDYSELLNPMGDCVPYLARGAICPTPSVASSLLCQSVSQL